MIHTSDELLEKLWKERDLHDIHVSVFGPWILADYKRYKRCINEMSYQEFQEFLDTLSVEERQLECMMSNLIEIK